MFNLFYHLQFLNFAAYIVHIFYMYNKTNFVINFILIYKADRNLMVSQKVLPLKYMPFRKCTISFPPMPYTVLC